MDNQRFTELLLRDLTGDTSPAEHKELLHIVETNEEFRKEYNLFRDYWEKKDFPQTNIHQLLEKVKDKIREQEEESGSYSAFSAASPRKKFRFLYSWRSIAAVFIVLISALGLYRFLSSQPSAPVSQNNWQEKHTVKGTRSRLTLADGTHITLNADSRLKYPDTFDGKTREVYLTGEAFFDVQKDAEHPFIIHTDKIHIKVLGTEFNVRCYPNDPAMETTLLRGSIEVTFTDRPADRIIMKPKDKLIIGTSAPKKESPVLDSIQLKPDHPDHKIAPVTVPTNTQYSLTGLTYFKEHDSTIVETSWVDDKLVFRNEEFLSLARKMERWYGLTIHFDNKALETYRFTGLFRRESISEALFALQLTENFKYKIKGTDVYIF